MANSIQNVAIIGAGLGGLGLALALHCHNISCTIYEQSPESGRFSGAIMLSPNSLRILDTYGVYERIQAKGWNFESCDMKNAAGETTDRYFFGSKKLFGYKAFRVYRNLLVKQLQEIVKERGIPIVFDAKYSHVVSESSDSVTFAFTNGSQETASLLIGCDGIHSKVRSYVSPGFEPECKYSSQLVSAWPELITSYLLAGNLHIPRLNFAEESSSQFPTLLTLAFPTHANEYLNTLDNGIVAVVGVVKRSKLVIPAGEPIAGPLMYEGKAGMFIVAPQDTDGNEIMAGSQVKYPAMDRAGWARLAADKEELRSVFLRHMTSDSEIVRSAAENIDMDTVYIWPQHTLPHLPRWISEAGKVILLADSAHCIPPTTGQGGGQAIEDGFSLALLLSRLADKVDLRTALRYWQESRQARVDKLLELTSKLNNLRLPAEERQKLAEGEIWRDEEHGKGEGSTMEWLFMPRLEETTLALVKRIEEESGVGS